MGTNQRGQSLVSVLVAAAIGGMVMVSVTGFTTAMFRSVKHTELTGELADLRTLINGQIDCDATFAAAGIDPNDPKACNTISAAGGQNGAGVYLRLARKTRNGSAQFLTTPLVGGVGQLGSYSLRATCSVAEQTIVVRAARPSGNGFVEDPLTKRPAGWDEAKGLLVGSAPSFPLCYGGGSSGPRRQGTILVGMEVFNAGEFVDVDVTGGAPALRGLGYVDTFEWTEPFKKSGRIFATASYSYVDVRNSSSNVTATPVLRVTYPSPGVVRIALEPMGDVEAAGGSSPKKGTVKVALTLTQY